jgi:hypothetical protein
MFVNEYVDYVNSITNSNPYPKGGSTGMYLCELAIRSRNISSSALRLFLVMACDANEYGQTKTSRQEYAKALEIKYSKSRMSKLFHELIDEKMIAMFGKYVTINPYIVMPRIKNPKIKAALQDAWVDMVELR